MAENPCILVVDDNGEVLETVTALLKFNGHSPICADSVKEGLKILRKRKVSLIITDILMPEKDGLEFIKEVRKTLPSMPIIAISGGGNLLDKNDCLKMAASFGATVVIPKPFNMKQLLSGIQKAGQLADKEARRRKNHQLAHM